MSDAEVWAQIQNNITDVLVRAQNARNKADSEVATRQYQEWEEHHFPMYITALAIELADDSKSDATSRQLAGILLRGCVVGKEEERKVFVEQRWKTVPMDARQEIKAQLWKTMSNPEMKYRHTAAEAVAAIAAMELMSDSWVDVVPNLASGVSNEQTSGEFKEACLIALKEICEQAAPKHIEPFSFEVLLAILTAMASPHVELQLASLKALASAIQFSDSNFEKEDQRNPIMSQVMKMAEHPDDAVRLAAFDCLVSVAASFYTYLPEYMKGGLKDLTLGAISRDTSEDVMMLAIEFWSTICEEESNIMRDNLAAADTGAPELELHSFIKGVAAELAEPLFQGLTKGDTDPNLQTWTVASAASGCISLMADTLGNEVVQHFVGMVSNTVNSPEEQLREASVLCFGSILDGPESAVLEAIVNDALPVFFTRLVDESPIVKRTTAWCFSRLAQFHPATLEVHLSDFLQAVSASLSDTADTPLIAASCAEAIDQLAQHVTEDMRATSPIVPYLGALFEALVVAESQPAVEQEPSLRLAIFAAIRSLIKATPDEMMDLIHTSLNTFLPRLSASSGGNPELEGELVSITSACIRRLGDSLEQDAVDGMMRLYLDLLTHYHGNSSMFQDTFMAIGSVVNAIGERFLPYMDEFGGHLNVGLQVYNDVDLFTQAVDVVSSLCFALGPQFAPWCPSVIKIFKEHLDKPDLPPSLGPIIITGYSDVVYALGTQFAEYLGVILPLLERMLPNALVKNDTLQDWTAIDAVNSWRTSILSCYIMILQNCAEDHSASIRPHTNSMSRLLATISEDKTRDDSVNRFACGLIYDMAVNFPGIIAALRRFDPFLDYCKYSQSSTDSTVAAAENAIDRLNK